MNDKLNEVLGAIEMRKKIIPPEGGLQFYVISHSTCNNKYVNSLRAFQSWVRLKYNVAIPVVGGGYGCTVINFEIVAQNIEEARLFIKSLIYEQNLHDKAREVNFRILILKEPWTRIDLARGTIEGGIGLEKYLKEGIKMTIDESTNINASITNSNVNVHSPSNSRTDRKAPNIRNERKSFRKLFNRINAVKVLRDIAANY